MLHEVLIWVQIAAYGLLGLALARKHHETGDRGFLWLGLAFCFSTVLIVMAQAWCTLVFWVHSPNKTEINAVFEASRSIAQALSLAVGIYMIGGKTRLRNFFRWIFSDDDHSESAVPSRSA